MRKLIILLLSLIFTLSSSSIIFAETASSPQKPIKRTGVLIIQKNKVSLKATGATIELTGKIKNLSTYNKKTVTVSGYLKDNKLVLKEIKLVRTAITPTPTKTPIPAVIESLSGVIVESTVEGLHYELVTEKGRYVLIGYDNRLLGSLVGKTITASGSFLENGMSIYQSGKLFSLKKVSVAPEQTALPTEKQKKDLVTLSGTILLDGAKGAHIGLLIDMELYGLSGNTEGLEALAGKKVTVRGFIPDIKYIRAPDYIMFEVTDYEVLD